MKIKITYEGILNGVAGIWCGFVPEGAEIKSRKYVLYPEEGNLLQDKEGNLYTSVILGPNAVKDDFTEIEKPKKEE